MSSSPICKCCVQIFSTNDTAFHSHHRSTQELIACTCSLCKFLCDGFLNSGCPFDDRLDSRQTNFIDFHYRLRLDRVDGRRDTLTIEVVAKYPNRPKVEGMPLVREIFFNQRVYIEKSVVSDTTIGLPSQSTDGREAWRSATHWLDTCLKTHSNCGRTTQPKWVPTRLLDVGTQRNSAIYLRVMDQQNPRHPYATLSHCWGKQQFLRLLSENQEAFKSGIMVKDLTNTFQDAIEITRRLGLRYLWIDSLCIIQENDNDWFKESAVMGEVYKHGFINIAATAAPNGRAGCFKNRDPVLAQKCRIRLNRPLPKFSLGPGLYDLIPRNLWEDGLYGPLNAPLNVRAWVVQERILAKRVLHFGRNQLFWECNGMDTCEMYPNGAPNILSHASHPSGNPVLNMAPSGMQFGFKRLHFKNLEQEAVRAEIQMVNAGWRQLQIGSLPPLPSGPLVDPYYVWNKVLLAYTRCELTQQTDKLVAISAIAKHVRSLIRDEYFAGMWKTHLEHHLLWHADSSDTTRHRTLHRTQEYVAPSWSWASITGRIEPFVYIRPDIPTMIQILNVQVTHKTEDITGQVSSGLLQLRGWLKVFSLIRKRGGRLGMDEFPAPQAVDTIQLDEHQQLPADIHEVWFLPVISVGNKVNQHAWGLVLLQSPGKRDEFSRVGRFFAQDDLSHLFTRPTYPLRGARVAKEQPKEKRGWFGKKKKVDDKYTWAERIITMI